MSRVDDEQTDPSGRSTPTLSSRETTHSGDSIGSSATNGPRVDHLRINIPGEQAASTGPTGIQPQRKKRDDSGTPGEWRNGQTGVCAAASHTSLG